MTINSVSKDSGKATFTLNASELVTLCNAMHHAKDKTNNPCFYHIYSNLMMMRDLSQYGHIDNFCFDQIIKCRENMKVEYNA